jgi:Phage tail sheath protein subtilisin-like domain/Phage tail sheath C-terminal domain
MAEKLVSPGVFTKENDLSFLQQGIADIGAAFIGPFKEGPLVPTIVNSQAEFQTLFGAADDTFYTPLAVQNYLREAGVATICRTAGTEGYTAYNPLLITITSGSVGQTTGLVSASVAIIFPTDKNTLTTGLSGSNLTTDGNGDLGNGDIVMFVTGSTNFTGTTSVDPEDTNDIESIFGTNPLGAKGGYVYGFFKEHGITFGATVSSSVSILDDQDFTFEAQEALTPMIQSQLISGERHNLFQFETIGAGNTANTKIKIGISNIKAAGSASGTDYGTFTVVVRAFGDTNKKKNILETFANVNLDPNSPNFISRVIGDRKRLISSEGKVTESGDWVNNSRYIRIANLNTVAPVQAVPFGHAKYKLPIVASIPVEAQIPTVSFVTSSATQFGGIDLDNNADNKIYMKPIPEGARNGSNAVFGLDASNGGSLSVGSTSAQFVVAFQEGFDGYSPATANADIVDPASAEGIASYGKHIAALSNADEYDINMVVAPHVNRRLHSSVFTSILDMVEQRADAFYIAEAGDSATTLDQTVTQAGEVDTNYAAFYYPYVKTIDVNTNKLITVPPSVLLPGVFAANDRVAAEWFAPAGLNRGGLIGAVNVLDKVTQSERDTLYEGKVNPICQFPGQGIVVWGQKTLQDKPSALDRINVRRLLLTVRKYIASTSKYLVFEQNSAETRNRFLNIVNPYLEGIQQRQGLYAFRVVMDETNNTPDVIDRNILKGAIYLQPTKTAEFIQIDFNILPTGASFGG